MVINDATILGFNRTRQYFEGDIFAKGDLVLISVEGIILDTSNDGGSISNTIAAGLSGIYEKSISTTNYNRDLGLIEGASHRVGGMGLETDRLVAGLGTDEIIINGTNYGRGRIANISSMTGPELSQSMTQAERFSIDLEILEDIGAINFTIAGSGVIDSGYAGLESALEPYAARLDTFQEAFNFEYGENGGVDYEHTLNIKYRDIPGDPLAVDVAKGIATNVFNSRPYFGEMDPDFEATNDPNQVITIPAMYPDTRVHDAYYTESYDQIGQSCSFSKRWSRYKDINTITSATAMSSIYGAGAPFGTTYTCNKSHQSTFANGISTVTENGEIRALSKHSMGAVFIGQESGGAYDRCNALNASTLFKVPVESTSYQDPVGNKYGYRISFTNDPQFVAGPTGPNNFGSMSVNRDYSVSRAEDGVIEIGSNHVARPHKRKESYSDEEITKTLDVLRAGHSSTDFFPDYKPSAGGALQTTTEAYNFGANGGEISLSLTETDDQQIFVNDGNSAFSKKSISVSVDHPVAEKETYLIAGCGEVVHVSPQSSLGTIEISFEGTLKRDMTKHSLTLATLETEAVDASTGGILFFEFKDILDEAYRNCSRYFAARLLAPSQVFITDTNYSFQGDRGFSMTITLNYTKDAYISVLEARR